MNCLFSYSQIPIFNRIQSNLVTSFYTLQLIINPTHFTHSIQPLFHPTFHRINSAKNHHGQTSSIYTLNRYEIFLVFDVITKRSIRLLAFGKILFSGRRSVCLYEADSRLCARAMRLDGSITSIVWFPWPASHRSHRASTVITLSLFLRIDITLIAKIFRYCFLTTATIDWWFCDRIFKQVKIWQVMESKENENRSK